MMGASRPLERAALSAESWEVVFQQTLLFARKFKFRFEVFLAKERRLINLFELRCDGISKPQDLAARLKLGVRTIESLKKRFNANGLIFT